MVSFGLSARVFPARSSQDAENGVWTCELVLSIMPLPPLLTLRPSIYAHLGQPVEEPRWHENFTIRATSLSQAWKALLLEWTYAI